MLNIPLFEISFFLLLLDLTWNDPILKREFKKVKKQNIWLTFKGWLNIISEKTETKNEKSHFSWSVFPKLNPYNNVKKPATELTKAHKSQPIYITQRGQYCTSSSLGSLEADKFVASREGIDWVVSCISTSFLSPLLDSTAPILSI